jgi:3-hydroxyisobutyrate dehydrogenase
MPGRVGVVGLGNMGAVIATRLATAYEVAGYDIRAERRERLAGGPVRVVARVEEAAEDAELLFLSLPDPAASAAVVAEVLPALPAGSVIVETSTVTPEDMRRLWATTQGYPLGLVDAAILGGVANVADGRTTFLVGGEPEAVERARPALDVLADAVLVQGPIGSGMAAKVIVNAVAHAVMVVLVEAAAMAVATNVSLDALYELLSRPTGLMRPLTYRLQELVRRRRYEGGMSTQNARKDSLLALETAARHGIPLFAVQAAHSVYEIAVRHGLGDLDYAAIATLWERWLGCDFSQPGTSEG